MKPFNFSPTASGASKVQPMSASDITRINRIRAANAAYPNILSNPPKNIGNLALSQSVVSSFNSRSAINRGIFVYNPVGIEDHSNSNSIPIQPVNTAKIIDGKLKILFEYTSDFEHFQVTIYPLVGYQAAFEKNGLTSLNLNLYLFEKDMSIFTTAPVVGTEIIIWFYNNDEKSFTIT
jgi:hypothetical protein